MSAPLRQKFPLRARMRGATLFEVMVASLVFLAGSLGAMAYLGHGRIALLREGRGRIAAQAAHSRLEELRTVRYAELEGFAEVDTPVALGGVDGSRTTEITPVDENENGATDYKMVSVTVSWLMGDIAQEVNLVTLFAPLD